MCEALYYNERITKAENPASKRIAEILRSENLDIKGDDNDGDIESYENLKPVYVLISEDEQDLYSNASMNF